MATSSTTTVLTALLMVVAALAGLAIWQWRRASRQLSALEDDLRRAEAQGREQASRLAALEALRDTSQLAEHAIATGTAVVKEVHKGIADIPFSVLEAIPGAREPTKALRGLHDSISEGIYGAIAGLNKVVGRELRKGIPLSDAPAATAIQAPSAASPTASEQSADGPPAEDTDQSRWG